MIPFIIVAREKQQALPKGTLPVAPTLLDCFLEALAKRDSRDPNPQVSISPVADQDPAAAKHVPVAGAQADLFSK